jgi:hypothetical protein
LPYLIALEQLRGDLLRDRCGVNRWSGGGFRFTNNHDLSDSIIPLTCS